MRLTLLAATAAFLAGCASAPPHFDVSDSIYRPQASPQIERQRVLKVEIRNVADDGKLVNTPLGQDSIFPIKPQVTTKETVEQDLRRFFDATTATDANAQRSLTMTILKADSYWVWGSASKIPGVGLLTAGSSTEFGLNLRVQIEVENGGKVVSSYLIDERITVQGSAGSSEAIQDSYRRLIAEYRRKVFGELEARFIRRYL